MADTTSHRTDTGRRRSPLACTVLFTCVVLLAGCSRMMVSTTTVSNELDRGGTLPPPLTWNDLYRATPVVGMAALMESAPMPESGLDADTLIQRGEALYADNCAPCHRSNGEGNLNRYPALNLNTLVTAQSPQPLIRTVLYGRGVMPAFNVTLSDGEVAAILSYIRNAWGNEAAVIQPADVQGVEPLSMEIWHTADAPRE